MIRCENVVYNEVLLKLWGMQEDAVQHYDWLNGNSAANHFMCGARVPVYK